jgi:hypothetical protein
MSSSRKHRQQEAMATGLVVEPGQRDKSEFYPANAIAKDSRLPDTTAPVGMQGRPASVIKTYRVRRIGHCNISEIFKNIILFLKLLKKFTIF